MGLIMNIFTDPGSELTLRTARERSSPIPLPASFEISSLDINLFNLLEVQYRRSLSRC